MIVIKGKYLSDSEIVLHLSKSFDGCLLFFSTFYQDWLGEWGGTEIQTVLREPGLFVWRVRQSDCWIFGMISFVGAAQLCLQALLHLHLHLCSFHTNTTLVLLAFCRRLTRLIASKSVHVNRKPIQTALVCLCITSGIGFWSTSYGLVRPTVPGSSAREMLIKVPSSSSTSASMAKVFSLSTIFFWVSDDHSSMSKASKMSHSSHHSLPFLLFLLSHSLTPTAWIIHIKVSSFPTWQVAQVTLLSWQPASQNRRLATPQGKLSGVKVWVWVTGSHKRTFTPICSLCRLHINLKSKNVCFCQTHMLFTCLFTSH